MDCTRKYYAMKIAGLNRALELFPINENLQIAAFIMFNDTEVTEAAAAELLAKVPEYDVIVTAECKGIPLAYEMARQAKKPYIVARKKPKLYMRDIISTEADSITTAGVQSLCIGSNDVEIIRGKKVLIADDVISSGGSLLAVEALVKAAGGIVAGKAAVLAEGDAAERKDIIFLEKLPLFDRNGEPL
ncbi:MAG: phosphoribosyltransferase family protein [bacterium]|nr:phosphoribosyltransferase family protein [bacterium]